MEGGKGRGGLLLVVVGLRVRIVRLKGEEWVCRAWRMWGPRLPVAPMRAMLVRGRGVDILSGDGGGIEWGVGGLGVWFRGLVMGLG